MTDPAALLREAHEACGCRQFGGTKSCQRPGYCACVKAVRPQSANLYWPPCLWSGHAASDRAFRAAFEAGEEYRNECLWTTATKQPALPKWLLGERSGD